jgi:hypothetical protein
MHTNIQLYQVKYMKQAQNFGKDLGTTSKGQGLDF